MDKVMFSKEKLLKYIELGVFKNFFEIKSRYNVLI